MSGVVALLRTWVEGAERLLGRVPELAALAAGTWPLAALGAALGVVLLVAGVRLGRVLAAAGGMGVGAVAAGLLARPLAGVGVPAAALGWVAAVLLGAAAAALPPLYPVALAAIPGALLGRELPLAGSAWLGAAAGAVVLGLLALLLRRLVLAASAAVAGAVLLSAAALALAPHLPALGVVTGRPVLLAGAAAVLAVAGTAFQLDQAGRGGRKGRERAADEPGRGAGA